MNFFCIHMGVSNVIARCVRATDCEPISNHLLIDSVINRYLLFKLYQYHNALSYQL